VTPTADAPTGGSDLKQGRPPRCWRSAIARMQGAGHGGRGRCSYRVSAAGPVRGHAAWSLLSLRVEQVMERERVKLWALRASWAAEAVYQCRPGAQGREPGLS